MTINFSNLTIEQLDEVISVATAQKEALQAQNRTEAWERIVDAIHDYIDKYGTIYFFSAHDQFYIDNRSSFSSIGEIWE